MRNRVTLLVLALVVCLPSLSEAAHPSQSQSKLLSGKGQGRNSHLADSPGRLEKAKVSVDIQRIDADETISVFGVDLVGHGVQPLVIEIQNRSDQTYRFSKTNVDAHYIPAANAARYAYPNPIITGLRFVRWIVCWIPAWILGQFVEFFDGAIQRPLMNQDVRADFVKEEIADTTVGPNSSLAGFMFLRALPPGTQLHMTLTNVQTQDLLAFDVPL